MNVYLCGPINGCTDEECIDWRTAVKQRLPEAIMIDPMARDYRGVEDQAFREIVDGDKADIDQADVVLVNYVKPSVGTSMEMLYAWERGKRIITICAPGASLSPWLRYHSHAIVHSIEDAVALVRQ